MPRTPEASAAVRVATRNRIRSAAILLMAENGYGATSLRQVAAKAGVANGLPSHYFGSKEGLLIDIADHWRARTRAALAKHRSEGPEATLRLLVRSALLGLDVHPDAAQESRAVAALLAEPQARQILRAANADMESADLLQALHEAISSSGSADPAGDLLLLTAALRGGLSIAAEDPSFPLAELEQVLVRRILPREHNADANPPVTRPE